MFIYQKKKMFIKSFYSFYNLDIFCQDSSLLNLVFLNFNLQEIYNIHNVHVVLQVFHPCPRRLDVRFTTPESVLEGGSIPYHFSYFVKIQKAIAVN